MRLTSVQKLLRSSIEFLGTFALILPGNQRGSLNRSWNPPTRNVSGFTSVPRPPFYRQPGAYFDDFDDLEPLRQGAYTAIQKMFMTVSSHALHCGIPWCRGTATLKEDLVIFLGNDTRNSFPLPLQQADLDALKEREGGSLLQRAEVGKGSETVVDNTVRSSWQVNPADFHFSDPANRWLHDTVQEQICVEAAEKLGLADQRQHLVAVPHKLLLYEQGDFFQEHTDTEKAGEEGAHIATLCLVLPSEFTGGAWNFGSCSRTEEPQPITSALSARSRSMPRCDEIPTGEARLPWAVWYNDVQHSLHPVTSGARLCLTYKLMCSAASVPTATASECEKLPVDEVLQTMERSWVPLLAEEQGRYQFESEYDGERLYNHLPFAVFELGSGFSKRAWQRAALGCLHPRDRGAVRTMAAAVERLPCAAGGASPLVAVLALVESRLDVEGLDEISATVSLSDLQLVAGSLGDAAKAKEGMLSRGLELPARSFSCLALRGSDCSSRRFPTTDAPTDAEEELLLGGQPAAGGEKVQVYGNEAEDVLEVARRRQGWALLVGPPHHFLAEI